MRNVLRATRPGQKPAESEQRPGRDVVVINPGDKFAACYQSPFSNPQGFEGRYFDLAMLSPSEVADLHRARPDLTVENPELRYGGQLATWLPPEPACYAFHRGEANGRPLASYLRELEAQRPRAGDATFTLSLSRVPRGGGETGEGYEVLTTTYRPNPTTTRPRVFLDGKEHRSEYWFDLAQGDLLVFKRSLTDGQRTQAGESFRIVYVRSTDGAWLPVYAASWIHPILPVPAEKYGGQAAVFIFTLANYDAARPDPAAGGFTWRDLGLRPGEDTLMLQSDDPARDGDFQVFNGELVEMNQAIRRRTEDERGGGL